MMSVIMVKLVVMQFGQHQQGCALEEPGCHRRLLPLGDWTNFHF